MENTITAPHPSNIRAAKAFFVAEHAGWLFYHQFADKLDNPDVADALRRFAGDEHNHADWYAEWLQARNLEVPSIEGIEQLVVASLRRLLIPAPLSVKLRLFSQVELVATKHLTQLVNKIQDPELRSIIEKTIPYERAHAEWYEREGRKMLR